MNTNWFYTKAYQEEEAFHKKLNKIARIKSGLITILIFLAIILLSWAGTYLR